MPNAPGLTEPSVRWRRVMTPVADCYQKSIATLDLWQNCRYPQNAQKKNVSAAPAYHRRRSQRLNRLTAGARQTLHILLEAIE